jgi:hypothetical protein
MVSTGLSPALPTYMDNGTKSQVDNVRETATLCAVDDASGKVTPEGNVDFIEVIRKENDKRTLTGKGRNDIHRRGAFQPDQYTFWGWYYLGYNAPGSPRAWGRSAVMKMSARVEAYLGSEEAQDFKAMVYGDFGRCGVCGAHFSMGEIWQHKDRMDLVHIGCDCCEKYEMVSGTDWNAVRDERERAIKGLKTAMRNAKARERIAAESPAFVEAIALFESNNLVSGIDFISNMTRMWNNTPGNLTPNMIRATISAAESVRERLARQAKIKAERDAEVKVAAPVGRDRLAQRARRSVGCDDEDDGEGRDGGRRVARVGNGSRGSRVRARRRSAV